jgi:hypothetical protein
LRRAYDQGSIPNFDDCAVAPGSGGSNFDFCPRPVYRWQHRLTERNPTGTELKVRLEKQCEWKRGSEILRSKIMAAVERAPCDGPEPTMHPPLMCNFRDIRPLVIGVAEMACGSKESNPPFPFPPGASWGGRVPPTPGSTLPASKNAGTHRCCRLPPQEGCRPLVHPPLSSGVRLGQK